MRTRWTVMLVVALLAAALFTASWLHRRPDFGAMPMHELVLHLEVTPDRDNRWFREAMQAYEARDPDDRWQDLEVVLRWRHPDVRRAAANALRLEDLCGPGIDVPDSTADRRVRSLLTLLDDDAVSLPILFALPPVCDAQRWQELPPEVMTALRRHLTARAPEPPDEIALFCVMQFGRICLPLQPELLAVDPALADADGATFLAAALGGIAWNNAAVLERLMQLLTTSPPDRSHAKSQAAQVLPRCGPGATAAVPALAAHIDAPLNLALRRAALLALAKLTRDPADAERALRILLRDRKELDVTESAWPLATSRFAARISDAELAGEAMYALEAARRLRDKTLDAPTYDAAIALLATAQRDEAQRRSALASLAERFARPQEAGASGFDRHQTFSGPIELLLDLHRDFPDAELDLGPVRTLLDEFERTGPTWIRDWAHHQRSRLPR